jgi:16S rRNA (adenine1518-N6/adenine1519-N6)-dimethyltransferase
VALRALLEAEGLAMTKRFGQNFLVNRGARERILAASVACLQPGGASPRRLWEIGPGLGSMTALALDSGYRLTAFEIDHGFSRFLVRAFGGEERFSLVEGDFLDTWKGEFEASGAPDLIFGNLPYNAASAFIGSLLEGFDAKGLPPPPMAFTVQKEAGARMAAVPGSKDYSSFSVLCSSACKVRILFDLAGGSFWPVPQVTSSVLTMVERAQPIVPRGELPGFSRFVRSVFASRRKTLRNNAVAAGLPPEAVLEALKSLGFPEAVRAEALRPEELARLYGRLAPRPVANSSPPVL